METSNKNIIETHVVTSVKTEADILADVLDNTRQLTRFYLSNLKDVDPSKRFTIGNFTTNSVHWVVAHLAWASDYLIIRGTGNKSLDYKWFQYFEIGKPYPAESDFPPYNEAYTAFKEAHEKSLDIIRSLTGAQLSEDNSLGVNFNNDPSKRMIIHHAIRHEGTHIGHLSWLLRLHGKKGV